MRKVVCGVSQDAIDVKRLNHSLALNAPWSANGTNESEAALEDFEVASIR